MARLTTAYAGHADITSENAGSILNQFLPQDPPDGPGLGLVFIPERVPRLQKGLKTTITWLEGEVGKDGTIPVPDLIAGMLARRDGYKDDEGTEQHDDLELYLLFDPENEEDVALANAANDADIPVRNLAAAGDYLTFEEAEPETPPFDVDTPEELGAEAADTTGEHLVAERAPTLDEVLAKAPTATASGEGVSVTFTLSPAAVSAVARAIVAEMANLGAAQVAAQSNGQAAPAAPVDPERPAEPTGRTEQAPGTSAFYYNAAKGSYRKARGMAKDGETKLFLTEAEQADARQSKMLV